MLNPEIKNNTPWQNEERYYRMIDEIEDYAIILLSTEGIIQNWNKGARKIKGYEPDEIIGKHFSTFYTAEDRARQLPDSLLEEARLNGRALHEGWRQKKDRSVFWGNIVITALHDDNGNVIGFLKLTRDLTERKEAELRREEYVRQLEDQRRSEERYHRLVDEVQD
ncbi:MAG: PAS domain S-box protein, partial [Chitinophagaceae bacterium]